ncbi:MAG TPA: hypothetical protein PK591_11470 [Ignavibacteriales bacterium]|nr:hypothetical protein [Ignavibacteriales bacterium]
MSKEQEQRQLWKWYITLPYDIIINKEIKAMDFYTYFVLRKEINTLNHSWTILLTTTKLKEITGYNDNITLKKRLAKLKEKEFIEYDFENFPSGNKEFIIKVIPFTKNDVERLGWGKQKQFEILDMELITKAVALFDSVIMQAKVIRLLYYFKRHYNNTFDSMGIHGYAVKSYKEITEDCCIQRSELNEINKLLYENYLCEKIRGELVDNKYPKNRYIPNFIINTKTGERLYDNKHFTVRLNKENKEKEKKKKTQIRRKKIKSEST